MMSLSSLFQTRSSLKLAHLWWAFAFIGTGLAIYLSLTAIAVANMPGDKTLHLVGYGLMMFWWGQLFERKSLIPVALLVVAFGVLMEFLQANLTDHRAYDVADMVANTQGVGIACLVLLTPLQRALLFVERQVFRLK